jgi:hypothetical protein
MILRVVGATALLRPLLSPSTGQHWVALCSKELHHKPAISCVTDGCSGLTLANSDSCGVFVTHKGRMVLVVEACNHLNWLVLPFVSN